MAKNDVKKVVAAEVEAPKEEKKELIDVQMTKAELDEYAAYAAKKKQEKEDAAIAVDEPKGSQMFRYNLTYQHNINGKKYGPGNDILIPEEHIGIVQQGENNSRQQEIKMMMSQKRMFQVLESGQSIPVPVKQ